MEDQSVSLINYIPSFARGCNVLLIHDDPLLQFYFSSLLEQYSFKVAATGDTSSGASMICDNEGMFKLIMAKANMPGMDVLGLVIERDIPVIFIGGFDDDDVTRNTLAIDKPCYFLQEPILDLKYLWEKVYDQSKACSHKETDQNAASLQNKDCIGKGSLQHTNTKQVYGASGGRLKGKIAAVDHKHCTGWPSASCCSGNRRGVWTGQLHKKFVKAVRALGENDAHPKWILRLMNEPSLTLRQVATHLVKYKLQLRQCMENATNNLAPSKRTNLGTKDLPAPSAWLNESQNEMKYAEPEVSAAEILKPVETPQYIPTELIKIGSQSANSIMEVHPVPMDGDLATEFDAQLNM